MVLASTLVLATLGLEPPDPRVEWSGNEACPGAEVELDRAIVEYLRLDAAEFARVHARLGLIDAGPAGLQLTLEIDSQAGHERHELSAIDCEQLLDQAALLIAGAIDPFAYAWPQPIETREAAAQQHHRAVAVQRPAVREQVARAAWPVPATDPPAEEPSVELAGFGPLEVVDTTSDRRPAISGAVSVGATGFVGVFPDPGGGVELEGTLERERLRWQAGVSGWFGGRFRSDQAEVGADLWALAFGSALCGVPGSERVRVPLCATAGVGFMAARAVGTVEPRRSTQPWAWAGVEARVLVLAREDFAVGLGIGAMAALIRPAWEVRSPGVRFTVPPAMGVLRLTFEARELRRRKNSGALAIKTP